MSQSKCSSDSAYYINIHILEAQVYLSWERDGWGGKRGKESLASNRASISVTSRILDTSPAPLLQPSFSSHFSPSPLLSYCPL